MSIGASNLGLLLGIGGVGLAATSTYLMARQILCKRRDRFPTVRKVVGETLALLPAPARTTLGAAWQVWAKGLQAVKNGLERVESGLERTASTFEDLTFVVCDEAEYGLGLRERPKPPEPSDLAMCNTCHGTGKVLATTCPSCEGKRFRRLPKDTVCPECNGGGRQMCKTCFGEGYMRCSCGGTGTQAPPPVPSPLPVPPTPPPPSPPVPTGACSKRAKHVPKKPSCKRPTL